MTKLFSSLLLAAILAFSTQAHAAVTLPAVISSGAVLQRQMPIPIWGWDNPGQEITVTLEGQTQSTKADANGFWLLKLPAREAGGPYALTIKGSTTADLTDILIGEVWFCSGQSNMAWQMRQTSHLNDELPTANRPTLRTLNVPVNKRTAPYPREWASKYPLEGKSKSPAWTPCTPESLPNFSGVAFHFGKNIQTELNVPVGLINSSLGGSLIEAWLSKPSLESNPAFKPVIDRQQEAIEGYKVRLDTYNKLTAKTKSAPTAPTTAPASQPATKALVKPIHPDDTYAAPAALYNSMVVAVAPYAIRGVIWYQGESNSTRPTEYQALLTGLITDWRKTWSQNDFPFLVVQLPNYKAETWPYIREAQSKAVQSLPNADYAVTIDLGLDSNIHPPNKRDVGARLALIALKNTYAKSILDRGPTLASSKIDGDKAILTFENTGSGLVTKDAKPPALFELAGPDGNYAPALAAISGNTITLTSDKVKNPKTVRFAWSATAPGFNLFNKDGLPAAPFRTDDKPVPTPPAPAPAVTPVPAPIPATLK
jgi:sialate O-acetylesterase